MNKKCLGCGAVLQNTDKEKEGYVTNIEGDFCERCFRINNYGDYKQVIKDNNTFINIIKDIDKESLVILVMDLFNLPENINLITENVNNNILLVLTKRDILPKVIYEERLLSYVDKYNLNIVDKIIVSSNKNYNFDNLLGKIRKYRTNDKIYIIGFTNAGKSTLINKLMYNYSEHLPFITTSILPSTTLNSIEIKFDNDITFIDTPGLLVDGSIENIVDVKTLKKIIPKKNIRPITYQIKTRQTVLVEDLLKLEVANNNMTMYLSNTLKVDRFYKEKDTPNLVKHTLNVYPNCDVVITGLGFIKFTKKETINIYTLEGNNVYLRKSLV